MDPHLHLHLHHLLLLSSISATLITQAFTFFIDFPLSTNYDQLATLIWSYDTAVFHGDHVLPPLPSEIHSVPNASVRVLYNQTFRLRNRDKAATFTANFVLNLGSEATSSSEKNEGVAFILSPELAPPAGSEGQWLGIANSTTNGTAEAKIFAIEFDTKKSFSEDVDGNHVGLDLNGVYSVFQKPLSEFGVNLSGMADVFVRVHFDGENVSVFVSLSSRLEDQLKSRVIFHPLNLSFLPDEVYVGFSASKFDYNSQLNWIKSWQFSGSDVGDNESNNHHRQWVYIAAGVGVGGLVLLFGVGFLWFWIMRKRKMEKEEAYDGIEDQLQDFSIALRVQKFRFRDLKKATDNFDPRNKLGRGGFGTVYKGNLVNREVAVKRISEDSRQGKQEFITEVATIGGLHHKNLVKLIGWCYEKRDFLLVYEYMPNGSLDKLIFGDGGDSKFPMGPSWEIRVNIIYGVAEALDYLHNGCEKTVLHRDVKSSNIMLDSKFEAKLGDFGLARTIRRTEQTHHSTREIAGTRGYMAPEIFLMSRATAETDVYAFGVVVLEVVCGRKAANPLEMGEGNYEGDITHWVWAYQERGEIVEAADERIGGQYGKEEMERVLVLGLGCCHPNPHQRPTMKNVLQVLKGELNPPVLPYEKPTFMWPPTPPLSTDDTATSTSLRDTQFADPFTELVGR